MTALLWSLGGLLIKLIEWNPMAIAGTRSALAALMILLFLRRPLLTWTFAQVGGAIAYAATVLLYVVANKLTTAANTILLQYTSPVYVALFGTWFLRERASVKDWVAIMIVLGGISLFFMDRLSPEGFWGNICALTSGVSFAWLTLFLRKQKSGSPLESVLLGNIITTLICIPFMFESIPRDLTNWGPLLVLGILQLGVSYILYSKAIKRVTALEAVLITMIEPILNPLWVFLVVGETQGPWSFVGGVIVLSTVVLRGILVVREKTTI